MQKCRASAYKGVSIVEQDVGENVTSCRPNISVQVNIGNRRVNFADGRAYRLIAQSVFFSENVSFWGHSIWVLFLLLVKVWQSVKKR